MEILIVSGQSGAGKSQVANIVEDLGYYCVDNMPMELLPPFAEMCMASKGRYEKVALITDVRSGQQFTSLFDSLTLIRAMNCEYRMLFVEARSQIIIRRYKETRRSHPLALESETLEQTVAREYELLAPVRAKADFIIDTTGLNAASLKIHIAELLLLHNPNPMLCRVISFGYKYGIPSEADLAFDVRFLPNPYHIQELRALSGLDKPIQDFVLKWPQTDEFLRRLHGMIEFLIPQYIDEGKTTLVIAIGCTGGRHRSVTVAGDIYQFLLKSGQRATLTNRDIDKFRLPGE